MRIETWGIYHRVDGKSIGYAIYEKYFGTAN